VITETQVEGSMILEAVPVEGIAPEAAVLEGATTGPEVPVGPEPMEEGHDDALPEASEVARDPRCGADTFGADVRGCAD
jgi:hypothetical protein